jgi:glycosyltransferase involved in cell wall biosynthesis
MYSGLIKEIEADADIVYTPYGPPPIFPYTRKAMVFSIHDIQHEYFPEFFTEEQLAERNYTFRTCTRNATLIQASSNQMKSNFLTTYTHLKDDQVFLAPEGVDLSFWSSPSDDSLQIGEIYRIPDRYIYLPAQLWKHKNHKTILFALFQLKKNGQAVHLVLSGARYSGADEIFRLIEDLDIKELVHYLGVIPIEHVRELMRKSVCVVTAALYESSSLPILETLAAGGRVLAGNTPPNIELSNKLNFDLFDNLSPESCADALLKIINSSSDIVSEINLSDFEWKNISKIYFKNFRNFSGVTNHV